MIYNQKYENLRTLAITDLSKIQANDTHRTDKKRKEAPKEKQVVRFYLVIIVLYVIKVC